MTAELLLRYFKIRQIIPDSLNKHPSDSSDKFLLGKVEENLNFDLQSIYTRAG